MKKTRNVNLPRLAAYFALAAFFIMFFGSVGARMVFGLTLLVLPFALLLRKFKLPLEETLIYSLFLTLAFFPVLIYYTGIIFGSIRLAMLVVFAVLLILGIIINLKKRNKDEKR